MSNGVRSSPPDGRIKEIDALRCVAMVAVVTIHSKLLPFGWAGVWLFYVISGYVVTGSLLHRPIGSRRQWLRDFYVRRAARILPIYILYIAVGVSAIAVLTGAVAWPTLGSLVGFYNNFAMMGGWGDLDGWPVGHLWTISVEMQFYAVYGLAFALLPRRTLTWSLFALLAIAPALRAVLGWNLARHGVDPLAAAYDIYASSAPQFDAFAAGALLALNQEKILARGLERRFFWGGLALLAVYFCVYAGVNIVVRHRHGVEVIRDVVSGILFGEGREIWLYSALAAFNAGLVLWTASGRAPWAALARNRFLQRVGEISYGAYVVHAATLTFAYWILAHVAGLHPQSLPFRLGEFAIGLAGALAIAEISYRLMEKPIARWAGRGLSAAAAPVTIG